MSTTTITEALAKLKTITKRISKKRKFIGDHLVTNESRKDPLERDGGTPKVISNEMQACNDLMDLFVRIKSAIAEANSMTMISILDVEKSIADWLVWRRDILPGEREFYRQLSVMISSMREQAQRSGVGVKSAEVSSQSRDYSDDAFINMNEVELQKNIERLEEIEGVLDGKLSLANATIMIEV